MKFSYTWLKDYIPSLPAPEKMAELLLTHSFEVEGIEKKGGDSVLSIDVLPNRIADASGHRGVAGEIGAIVKKSLKLPKRLLKETNESTAKAVQINVTDKKGCPRYVARVLQGVTVSSSPAWLSGRLGICGVNSINVIVDVANYVMLDMVQPLHAFDADKIKGALCVRRASKNEAFVALDGAAYTLGPEDLVIADEEGPLAIAGIKGGKRAGVEIETKNIILEAANFDPESIERTAKRIGLLTDAAVRFRIGIDPNLTVRAINEAAALIQQLAGGTVLRGVADTGKNIPDKTILLRLAKTRSVLGFDISEREILDICKRLGFVAVKQGENLKVKVPSVRVDLVVEEDLIEELARMHGLGHLNSVPPTIVFTDANDNAKEKFRRRVGERIAALGYSEIYSYVFTGEQERDFSPRKGSLLKLRNPLQSDTAYLRTDLAHSLLSALAKNQQFEEARVFEIGAVFCRTSAKIQDTTELEEERIALGFFAKQKKESPFFELKGALFSLLESFGIDDFYFGDVSLEHKLFHPFRSAEIKTDRAILGMIGEIHPRAREAFGIKSPAAIAELSFVKLYEAASSELQYKEVSKYPSITRDIALLVPLDTRVADVEDVIENTGGTLLADTDLIDIYEGTELPDGKKNFAFRLVFQAPDRTLTDGEVNAIVDRIIKTLEAENLEWEVRK